MNLHACSEKAEKTDPISLSPWKNGRGLLFWNHISLKNTLKTKQNWQCRIYCLQLFCLQRPLFAPLPWKRQGYLSLQPFYNNVPFLTKQQRKYQVKPLPPSNDQVNSAPVSQAAHAQSHVCPHAAALLMRNVQFMNKISVLSLCVYSFFFFFFFFFILFFLWKRKRVVKFFYIYALDVGRLKAVTLDGDRENWLPGCISDIRSESSRTNTLTKKSIEGIVPVSTNAQNMHLMLSRWLIVCRNLEILMNFTCSECSIFPPHRINLIIHFSQIKCALCSHLRTSCKSLWLVYTPVYSSCRLLSPS